MRFIPICRSSLSWVLIALGLTIQTNLQAQAQPVAPVTATFANTAFPNFSIRTLDSTVQVIKPNQKQTLILYFSPTCGHCQEEAKQLVVNIAKFKKVRIIMVSSYDLVELRSFAKTYNLLAQSNILIGQDMDRYLARYYAVSGVPFLVLYDKENKLVKAPNSNISIPDFVQYLQ